MESWVYLFSKFTHEALLLEALILLIGVAAYLAYYLTKRRKFGIAGKELPANLVRVYLSQLMADAEDLKIQLFGLLGKGEAAARLQAQFLNEAANAGSIASGASSAGNPYPVGNSDDRISAKLAELEAKMMEQASALDSVLQEKMRLEEELAVLRSRETPGSAPASTGPSAEVQAKLKQLENQLAEYAVIEDDLANLKRLQKENKDLREQLAKMGGAALPASPTTPNAAVPAPTIANSAATAPAVAGQAPVAPPNANFDALVDQVEASLANPAAPATANIPPLPTAAPAAASPQAAAPPSPTDNPTAALAAGETTTNEKTEEQLQADFEKMLNS